MQVQKTKGGVGTEHPGLWFVLSDSAWDSFGTCGERSSDHTCASLLQQTGAGGAVRLFPRLSCCVCGRAGLSVGEQGCAEGCASTSSLQGWLCLVLCTSCPCRTSQCCGCPSVPGHVLCLRAHFPGAGAGIPVLAAQPGSVPVSLGQLGAGAVQPAQGTQLGLWKEACVRAAPSFSTGLVQGTRASFDFSKYLITSHEKLHFPCSYPGPELSCLQLLCILFMLSSVTSTDFFLYCCFLNWLLNVS